MKKFLKIIFFNLLFLFIILLTLEFALMMKEYKGAYHYEFQKAIFEKKNFDYNIKKYIIYVFNSIYKYNPLLIENKYINDIYRAPSGLEHLKENKPIIIVGGCSYTYGQWLHDDETLSAVLSKYSQKAVYNIGLGAASPRSLLYILRNDKLRNLLLNNNKNVQYVIYTYISDHKDRLLYDKYKHEANFRVINKDGGGEKLS